MLDARMLDAGCSFLDDRHLESIILILDTRMLVFGIWDLEFACSFLDDRHLESIVLCLDT
jgi:hypothetical protein